MHYNTLVDSGCLMLIIYLLNTATSKLLIFTLVFPL